VSDPLFRPTGEQHVLRRRGALGEVEAIVTEVAAGLRLLTVGGVALTQTFAEDALRPFGTGIALAPWPNRVRDGRWTWNDKAQLLDFTEPDRVNALHGLLRNAPYTVVDRRDGELELAATVFPQHGYPFQVETRVRYRLTDDGIAVTHSARNLAPSAAPVALGSHPFFAIGDERAEDLALELAVASVFEVDERRNPTTETPVAGTAFDFTEPHPLGEVDIDHVLRVTPGPDGVARHRLHAPSGRVLEVWQGEGFGFTQVMTPRTFPTVHGAGLAIALEPQSSAPDAFNSGDGVRWLEQGETWSAEWGVVFRP
jgi:aldose 1-epimerase